MKHLIYNIRDRKVCYCELFCLFSIDQDQKWRTQIHVFTAKIIDKIKFRFTYHTK